MCLLVDYPSHDLLKRCQVQNRNVTERDSERVFVRDNVFLWKTEQTRNIKYSFFIVITFELIILFPDNKAH